ncbi:MAG: hypothetical protein UT13_C0001G0316 [Candidatus Pacebacteria bacterium GW2011_GWF2_38_9]|nr:MAG: hypothetical protein US01_C0001G0324 [candidate division TM6 bacterium GW2011_GWF2_28_16]KKQ10305.1 MAG: hypothetical protein US20_C0001G0019 [Candidatus Pacebacteria bacterium GW2011_GWF1_36_5]KKQ88669.1 MAG: hypothetical protein UT13_C0001G0316 [Candidatus Pacebacteria bacterium GW2011_GWF2_38_9]HAZ73685.1 hypothetical protein [Candidatus Paceibacterota bacterium]
MEKSSQTQSKKEGFLQKIKGWASVGGVIAIIVYSFYFTIFKTTNEVGFMGMDKVGRQVFIQSMDAYLDPNVDVDSDFFDYNILYRLVIQEPMRTVLKFDIRDENEFQASPESVDAFLASPASGILDMYQDEVMMQEEYRLTPEELKQSAKDEGVETVSDLLSGFGFERFDVYSRGSLIKSVELPKTENVGHAGG